MRGKWGEKGDKEKPPTYENLPDIDVIADRKKRLKCRELFEELDSLDAQIEVLSARAEEIKLELESYQYLADAPGIRYGQLIYSCSQCQPRKTLNAILLQENGVAKHIVDDSYKLGKPFMRRVFTRLK